MNSIHYVIFGGAGYTGLFLEEYLSSIEERNKISIVTRNESKKIFFRRPNTFIVSDVKKIKNEKIKIINLAYALDKTYHQTKASTFKLFNNIEMLVKNNNVDCLVHISTIVLTQNFGISIPKKLKKDSIYTYSKLLSEQLVDKIKANNPVLPVIILRSGNIMGPGSTWAVKIAKSIENSTPITGPKKYPSNTTFVGNLVKSIHFLSNHELDHKKLLLLNCAEFADKTWDEWIIPISELYGKKAQSWNIEGFNSLKISISSETRRLFKQLKTNSMLFAYKSAKLKNLILLALDLFKIKSAESNAKKSLNRNIPVNIPDFSEYSLQSVFLNEISIEKNKFKIPTESYFNFEQSLKLVIEWIKISGDLDDY